eukprot:8275-Heterococcus_DN1.PRE.4
MALSAAVARGVAESGCLYKLKWFGAMVQYRLPNDICDSAAKSGNIDMLRWLLQGGYGLCASTAYQAALAGHKHVLKFLNSEACTFDKWSFTAAAYRGDLDMLRWLQQQGCPRDALAVSITAVSSGNVPLMMWLKEQHVELYPMLMLHAAEHGHLNMCRYLVDQGGQLTKKACKHAARGGHTETLRWLLAQGCPYKVSSISRGAASSGSIGVLTYVLELGAAITTAPVLTSMLTTAGAFGHLDAAKWLRKQGAVWPEVLEDEHASWANPERVQRRQWSGAVLQWARQEGCVSPVTTAAGLQDVQAE